MNTLTARNVDVLIEAIDHWPDRKSGGSLMIGIMGAMLANTPEQKAKEEEEREARAEEDKQRIRADKETAVRIKVKLLNIRDALALEEGKALLTED